MDFANIFNIFMCYFKKDRWKDSAKSDYIMGWKRIKKFFSQDIRHRHKEQRRSISKEAWEAQSG